MGGPRGVRRRVSLGTGWDPLVANCVGHSGQLASSGWLYWPIVAPWVGELWIDNRLALARSRSLSRLLTAGDTALYYDFPSVWSGLHVCDDDVCSFVARATLFAAFRQPFCASGRLRPEHILCPRRVWTAARRACATCARTQSDNLDALDVRTRIRLVSAHVQTDARRRRPYA